MALHIALCMALCVTPLMVCSSAYATQWQLLKATHGSQLMIDKQSITEQAPYTKAWVKMEYREPQKNLESVDRVYTHARALWYFDCATRKAATLQVFQYDADALVYSAGIEVKQAEFVEPLPESEVEIAQQYVCQRRANALAAAKPKTAAPQGSKAEQADGEAKANTATPSASTASAPAASPPVASPQPAANQTKPDTSAPSANPATAKKDKPPAKTTPSQAKAGAEAAASGKTTPEKKSEASNALNWQYEGAQGPSHWAELSPDYLSCGHGQQQSPIAIEQTIPAALKPLKALQKFPLKSISNDGHGLRLDAGSGNMMVLDQQPYQMKTISLHFPAEHLIRQKRYAGELQMLHEDKQGHRVMLTVMIEEGRSHPALEKLLGQLPKAGDAAKMLALRITPAELMPEKTAYYRYSGSLTTPPCSEGVQWVVMKKPIQASPAQLVSLQQASHVQNQRPLQDHQGRLVLE